MWGRIGLVLLGVILTRVHAQEGEDCRTPNALIGTCVNIRSCNSLLKIIRSNTGRDARVTRFLQDSTCGFSGNQPLVCCPDQRPTTTSTTTTTTTTTTSTERPSEGRNADAATHTLPRWPYCGLRNDSLGGKVVGGRNAALGEFPWIVALGYRNLKFPSSDNPLFLCGGSLITEKHVLTAAHCIRSDLFMVRVGDLDLYDDDDGAQPIDIPIKKAIRYHDYNPSAKTGDIALLVLSRLARGYLIAPICLPVQEPLRSNSFVGFTPQIAGWGAVSFHGPSSPILQVAQVPVISTRECQPAFQRFFAVIDDTVLCAYHSNGTDACGGDSGGPLVTAHRVGIHLQMYQIGVVSYGYKCAEPGYPGVYTRVSAFIDWIEKNLED